MRAAMIAYSVTLVLLQVLHMTFKKLDLRDRPPLLIYKKKTAILLIKCDLV
jgi:hypothetical protein